MSEEEKKEELDPPAGDSEEALAGATSDDIPVPVQDPGEPAKAETEETPAADAEKTVPDQSLFSLKLNSLLVAYDYIFLGIIVTSETTIF